MKILNFSSNLRVGASTRKDNRNAVKGSETYSMPSLCLLRVPSISRYPYVKVSATLRFDNIGSEGGTPLNLVASSASYKSEVIIQLPGLAERS